jgi:preprotein translocase subunit SecE
MARETRENEFEDQQPAGQPAMNRAMRRMQKKSEAKQAPSSREQRRRPAPPTAKERVGASQFFREVRGELKKVAWPTRSEVVNSTIIVLIAVVVLTTLIFGLDYAFGKFVLYLYE